MASALGYLRLLLPRRRAAWSIGIFEGADTLQMRPHAALDGRPVLTRHSLGSVRAHGVADPFMVRHGDGWLMFFEIENIDSGRGEIGLARSSDALAWTFDRIVLRESFHLSYPCVIETPEGHFMMPECEASGGLRLYRAIDFPLAWELHAEIPGLALADATPFQHDGRWWLIALKGFRRTDEFVIYHAPELAGPWTAHTMNPIARGERRRSRPAGSVVRVDGKLVRFAQDYAQHYGACVRASVIETLTPTAYAERPATPGDVPILGANAAYWSTRGMHHIDAHQVDPARWLACVDGQRSQWTWPVAERLAARFGRRV